MGGQPLIQIRQTGLLLLIVLVKLLQLLAQLPDRLLIQQCRAQLPFIREAGVPEGLMQGSVRLRSLLTETLTLRFQCRALTLQATDLRLGLLQGGQLLRQLLIALLNLRLQLLTRMRDIATAGGSPNSA